MNYKRDKINYKRDKDRMYRTTLILTNCTRKKYITETRKRIDLKKPKKEKHIINLQDYLANSTRN